MLSQSGRATASLIPGNLAISIGSYSTRYLKNFSAHADVPGTTGAVAQLLCEFVKHLKGHGCRQRLQKTVRAEGAK